MTYKKIAELANVSLSTVSKALSGSKEVSEELTEKIRKIALETGYFKEKNKRKIEYKKVKTTTVAIICPEIISIHYSKMITSIKNEVEKRGGLICVYIYDFDYEKLSRIIASLSLSKEIDGIITFSRGSFEVFPNIPVVCVSESGESGECDTLYNDWESIFVSVAEYLKELGHRKIGFVGETNTVPKEKAFLSAMKACGLYADKKSIYNISERFEKIGELAAEKIVKDNEGFSAFITAYDEVGIGLIHGLAKYNIRVPEDISVVGINDIPYSGYSSPPLTTVRISFEEQCSNAVKILYDKIMSKSNEINHIFVDHRLIVRGSTASKK